MKIDTDKLKTVANYAHDERLSMRWIYDCLNNDKHPLEGIYIDGVRFVVTDNAIIEDKSKDVKTV